MGCVQSTNKSIEAACNLPHCAQDDAHIVVKDVSHQTPRVPCVKAVDDVASSAATPSSNASVECPHVRFEQHAGVKVQVNRCPFGHGSVGAGPFPGYVHGTDTAICKEGCKPDPALGKYGRLDETPRQTLVREALEYQEVYHMDKDSSPAVKEARVKEILEEIEATGTYTHTYDELQHGGRVAWRNAPKCSNRKFWEELQLIDGRHAKTATEMFEICLEILEKASVSCVTTANIAVFRPQTPGTTDGPRVWNNQLVRYAGYGEPGGDRVIGDPAEKDFTDMVIKEYGWQPPDGNPGRYDILPLLLQPHPEETPQMFEIPSQYVVRVPIRHPTNERISALGMQWYAVPAVSCLELSVGGLTYTAAPFNGWYADTEIVRNLTDSNRLNLCAEIAACMGLETKNDTTLWRDRAIVEVDVAVMNSFREAGMGMVDHHTLMRNFWKWWHREKRTRGYSPGNWKWIIPPISPTANISCYLHLNKMTEYTVKPGYWYAPGWRKYREALNGSITAKSADARSSMDKAAVNKTNSFKLIASSVTKVKVLLIFATVTGTTQQFTEAIAKALESAGTLQVQLMNMEDFESDSWGTAIESAAGVLLMSSTYGPGAPPGTATKFINWLTHAGGEAGGVLKGKPFAVLGFGSSSYPRFCAAAELLHSTMLSLGASSLMPMAKADALAGEEGVVWPWVKLLSEKMIARGWLDGAAAAALVKHLPMSETDAPTPWKPEYNLFTLKGEGLQAARERGCHWATLLESEELLDSRRDGSSTRFLCFNIENVPCGSYYVGDEVAVWGENPSEVVLELAANLGITSDTLDDMFMLQKIQDGDQDDDPKLPYPLPNSFRTILTRHLGLTERIQFSALAALAPCAPQDVQLQDLASSYSKYSAWASEVVPRWADLFKLFPALIGRIPLATFFTIAPQVKPRYYSISSSSAVNAGKVAICVGRLQYKLSAGDERQGFCSSFLTGLQPGSRVRFRLVSQPAFRMPFNLAAPVIMIAAGTGIAPFKGFWEERVLRLQQEQQLGPGILLFGCRSSSSDYLFKDTLNEMTRRGAISKTLIAFSREQGVPKTYVQDLVPQRADELKPLLMHPRCHVYVCGSSNMAQEVSRAMSKLAGKQVFDAVVIEGRYHEDVFGMNVTNHQAAAKSAQQNMAIKSMAKQSLTDVLSSLEKGLDVNTVDETGSSLLHYACAGNRLDLATTVITRGAVPNPVNNFGLTPLAEAALAGHTTLVAVLQSMGGKRVDAMREQFYPLHAAVMMEDEQQVEQILSQGADPNQPDFLSTSPLHIAVVLGNEPIVEKLLEAGAETNVQNRMGITPLQLAVSHSRPQLAQLLGRFGAVMQGPRVVTGGSSGAGLFNAETPGTLQGLGISQEDVAVARASWSFASGEAYPDKVRDVLADIGVKLFLALFDMYPHLLEMFPFKDDDGKPILKELEVHGLKVASTLGEVVDRLQNAKTLDRYLTDLVERHVKYGVELVHYDIVVGAIHSFLGQMLQNKLSAEQAAAWGRILGVIKVVAQREYSKMK